MTQEVRYTPGEWYLAVGPRLTVLSDDEDLVRRMWPVVRDGGDAAAVLVDAVTGGLASLPDLALIDGTAEHAEFLVRGDIEIVLETADSDRRTIDGRGVRTWREASAASIRALSVGGMDCSETGLPLRAGLVRAGGFRWSLDEAAEPPAESAAGTPAAPAAGTSAATQTPDRPAEQPGPAARPSATAAAGATEQPSVMPAAPAGSDDTKLGREDEFGHLFESTVVRGAEDAAVRIDADDEDGPSPAPESVLGDHDGSTILGSHLADLLRGQRAAPPSEVTTAPITATAAPPAPPAALELVFSTGQVVPADQPVIVGRKPQADRVSSSAIPRLITVTGPNNDISRSHLELRPDGRDLLVTDLGSTNGTVLVEPAGSRPLTARLAERIGAGTRLDLGDGVTIDIRTAR